jgi:hypothetical protein
MPCRFDTGHKLDADAAVGLDGARGRCRNIPDNEEGFKMDEDTVNGQIIIGIKSEPRSNI